MPLIHRIRACRISCPSRVSATATSWAPARTRSASTDNNKNNDDDNNNGKPPPGTQQTTLADIHEIALRAARARRIELLRGLREGESKEEYGKRYNQYAFRWTSGMVALPIALVTSYYLFGRLFFGKEAKVMPRMAQAGKQDE
ncbi:hypothetical protein CDD82_7489 [Ophiocordyceps australis]|uniref:Uncharacterized protein n=1 Tax=Ophiocordyceps australis TaxID=1399860 RepID=A0A2C5YQ48_9HYPO|nr:hypothetical protein CDD82_7489 [Ophiocordyceps australis]